ncbi:SPASM domain-containing protein [Pelagibacteraceae bacterium]|nr:SPASM domain-containing protein [Pelagibacteraceae bacterium]
MKIIDKNIPRKKQITKDRLQFLENSKIPLMSVVEISNSGLCNRKCSFCPRSDPNYPDINEFISKELHYKIFSELSDLQYNGMVIYSGYVEPLLDVRIYESISEARKFLPKAQIELITNGDVLNLERLKKLFDSGLSTLLISVYDGPKEEENFYKLCEKANLKKNQYVIRNRYKSSKESFGINLSNRSGTLENAEYSIKPLSEPLSAMCNYPAYTFFVDYNGDVQMCSHDWAKKYILGNVKKEKIIDIWCNKKFQFARKKLLNSDRSFSPCNKCDVAGELIGNVHAKKWLKNL